MPQLPPYIPAKDTDLDAWAANFSTLITASPGTYGLVAADATAIAAIVATWHAAYLLITSPTTKTATTVAAKDTAKINLLATVRPYSIQVSLNAGVSPSNKTALGVSARTSVPTPIPAPTTSPAISITAALPQQHVLRYRDETSSPSVKSKPYGAIACQIFALASGTNAPDLSSLMYKTQETKSPTLIEWQAGDVGKTAWYAGRWVTRKGLEGPFSALVNFVIAG